LGELSGLGRRLGVGGNSGNTVFLDAEAVTAHGHLEETVDSPVGTPRVTAPPEGSAVSLNAESSDGDLVVDERESDLLGVDTSGVEFESVGDMDTTRDGSVLGDLSLHLSNTLDLVMVSDVVSFRSNGSASFHARLTRSRWGRGAVTALIDGRHSRLQVEGSVLHARSSDKTYFMCGRVDTTGVTTVARATLLGIDNGLGIDGDGSVSAQLVHDVESISNCGGRSLSPARPAVLGNVLVLVPGKVVDSVHVSPVDGGGNIFFLEFIPGVRGVLDSTLDIESSGLNTASLLGGLEEGGLFFHLARF